MEYAILGGGALGLMTAYRLAQAGQSVIVFEQEKLAGGLASGFKIGDAWLEKFYHHIFRSDKMIIQIINELGLQDRLEWQQLPHKSSHAGRGMECIAQTALQSGIAQGAPCLAHR